MSSRKYKILLIQPCYENFGGFFSTFAMAKAFSRARHNATMIISSKDKSCRCVRLASLPGLTQIELPRNFFGLNGRFIRGILACWHILLNKYDFIICFGITQPESNIPLVFAHLLGRKIILSRDEFWQANLINSSWIMGKYLWFCEEILIKLFNNHRVPSDLLLKHSRKTGAKNIIKIVNGVDFDQFKLYKREEARKELGLNPKQKIILAFGNTYEDKRAFLLFKAFEEILKLDSSVKLIVNQQNIDVDREIKKNIVVTGFIKPERIGIYLGASDIVLFLTTNAKSEQACFPIRIGSYLNGEAVIATLKTDTEWCRTLIKYDCAIIEEDTKKLASKIVYYFNHKDELNKLRARAKVVKNELSWDRLGERIIKFFDEIR